ncbi:conserved Plasmodium protein, unknown function [Plasmodium ovale]|uniref:Uncharacterized protein n=1 Tax=Plasmodium ovale TaxID=36330 RepID=A0A1C3KSH3_PLAOA|nr:conserved Plasmodium protein, unknown function [Plasmodium ovale]
MNFSLIIKRYSKILNWKHDTYYASLMNKYVYFDEFMRFCNDNKEKFSKRDMVASLTYIHHMKKVDLLSPAFNSYNDFIFSNINIFRSNISTLVHRYAILGHTKSLLFIYENVLKNNILNYDNKTISLIAWSYAKNNFYLSDLFMEINKILRGCIKTMTLHELSLISWAYSKINRLPPLEMVCVKNRVYELLNALDEELNSVIKKKENNENHIDEIKINVKEKVIECENDEKDGDESQIKNGSAHFNDNRLSNESKEMNSQKENLENAYEYNGDNEIDMYGCSKNLSQDVYMKINDDDLWKQFGVAIQKKAIDLELAQIKKLHNIFTTNGKGNDRILGVLDTFIQVKEDINAYGPI